uniref:Solute-binding protein family 5 domain-containing protein n=1 Tax=candidate division WOR-3 bacterium TaxID=2052148 RepID=A0A7C4THT9_UNCW3
MKRLNAKSEIRNLFFRSWQGLCHWSFRFENCLGFRNQRLEFYRIVVIFFFNLVLFCASKQNGITIVFDAPPLNLDPHLRKEIVTISILSNIYETLLSFDANMKMEPGLAEYWERIDSLRWRFYLGNGIKFHNGKILSSEDVLYSLYRPLNIQESEYATYRDYLDTVLIEDKDRFIIKLKKPYPLLLYDLATIFIVPENFQPEMASPCGTGPYYFFKMEGQRIGLRYFSDYRTDVAIKEIQFLFVSEPQKRIELLRKRQADIVTFIPLDLLDDLKRSGQVVATPGVATRYLEMDLRKFPYSKREFRQAINLALNRERIVKEVYHGYAAPANQFIPQGLFGFDYTLPLFLYNPDSAKKIIKRLGPLPEIELDFALVRAFIGAAIIDDLKNAGIKVKANPLSADKFWQKIEHKKSSFYLIGSVPTSNEGITTLKNTLHTYLPQKGLGMQNQTGYSNLRVDSLIEETVQISDLKKATRLLIEAQRILLRDLPKIPVVWEKEIYGTSERIDWTPRLDEKIIVKEIKLRK